MTSKALRREARFFEAMRGDEFGVLFHWVPWKWVRELDTKVDLLTAEIKNFYGDELTDPFYMKWVQFVIAWRLWYIAHEGDSTRRGEEAETSFTKHRNTYDRLRTEFVEVEGGETKTETAKPWIEVPPTEKTGTGSLGIDLWPIAIAGVAALGIVILIKR